LDFKSKTSFRTILISVFFFLFLLIWTLWQFHFNYMVASYDTIFHSQRIYEIRLAFNSGQLPSWVNFHTFFFTGQAINGMYPDYTLWPFVFITDFLTPIHQIIAIRTIIAALSFIVTYFSLSKRFDSMNAILAASIFAMSGSVLKDLTGEMQTGTAIIMIFIFPLLFTLKDIIQSDKYNLRLIIKTALLMTLVVNSHLLTAVVITMVGGLFLIINTIIKRNYMAWFNLVIAASLTLVLCLPIIYRIIKISKTGLLPPFGAGHIGSVYLIDLFKQPDWDAKSTFSASSIILLILSLLGIRKWNLKKALPWLLLEVALIILSSNIFPWELFNHVPIIDNFQFSNWRFGIFLGVVPMILIFTTLKNNILTRILLIMTIASYPMATYAAIHSQTFWTVQATTVTKYTQEQIPQDHPFYMTSTGINSDKVIRSLLPDYSPDTTSLQKGSNGMSLDWNMTNLLTNHVGQDGKKGVLLSRGKSSIKGITWTANDIGKGKISLPTYGYKSLRYRVTLNGKHIPWSLNKQSLITVSSRKNLKQAIYKVTWITPKIYYLLMGVSFVVLTIMIWKLIYYKKVER